MLERAGGSVRVHPDDETSVFVLLLSEESEWVVEMAADAIVAVPGPGAYLLGVLVVGRRFDDRTLRPSDIPFLEALAAAAGLAVAREGSVCGIVAGPDERQPASAGRTMPRPAYRSCSRASIR